MKKKKRINLSGGVVAHFSPEFHLLLEQDLLDLKKIGVIKRKDELVEIYTQLGRKSGISSKRYITE
jgi:hypothetical protein